MIGIDLAGKIAVVTGATGELGPVMVRTLAQCGAHVAIAYHRNKSKAEKLVDEARGMGVRAIAVRADVTKQDSLLKMRDSVTVDFPYFDLSGHQVWGATAMILGEFAALLD